MTALKPRTGDGPLEVEREGRGIVVRTPADGRGCLVSGPRDAKASELKNILAAVEH